MNDILTDFGDRVTMLCDQRNGLRRSIVCEVRQPDQADDELFDFIASDASLDRYNETINLDGWQLDNYRRNPVVVDSHCYDSIARILGSSVSTEIRDGKLVNRVRFAVQNPLGKLARDMTRAGFIRAESVGFVPVEWKYGNESQGEPYRTFLRQELVEISLVAVPANPAATIGLAVHQGHVTRRALGEVIDLLRSLCSPRTTPEPDVRSAGPASDAEQPLRSMVIQLRRMLGKNR